MQGTWISWQKCLPYKCEHPNLGSQSPFKRKLVQRLWAPITLMEVETGFLELTSRLAQQSQPAPCSVRHLLSTLLPHACTCPHTHVRTNHVYTDKYTNTPTHARTPSDHWDGCAASLWDYGFKLTVHPKRHRRWTLPSHWEAQQLSTTQALLPLHPRGTCSCYRQQGMRGSCWLIALGCISHGFLQF